MSTLSDLYWKNIRIWLMALKPKPTCPSSRDILTPASENFRHDSGGAICGARSTFGLLHKKNGTRASISGYNKRLLQKQLGLHPI
jgi:hypothetical protein